LVLLKKIRADFTGLSSWPSIVIKITLIRLVFFVVVDDVAV